MNARATHQAFCTVLGTLCLLVAMRAGAQSPAFTQLDLVRLNLNPAFAGLNDRYASLLHRTQWKPGVGPFRTTAAMFDAQLKHKGRTAKGPGRVGLGTSVFNDRSGSPVYRVSAVNASVAYHLRLDQRSSLGAGLYVGIRQYMGFADQGAWASQYDGLVYDPSRSSGEQFGTRPRTVADVGGGLVYDLKADVIGPKGKRTIGVQAGISVLHGAQPRVSLDLESNERLARRLIGFARVDLPIGSSRLALEPMFYGELLSGSLFLQAGSAVRFTMPEKGGFLVEQRKPSIALGAYYRTNGTVITTLRLRWDDLSLGLSYGMNTLRTVAGGGGGTAELGLNYAFRGER